MHNGGYLLNANDIAHGCSCIMAEDFVCYASREWPRQWWYVLLPLPIGQLCQALAIGPFQLDILRPHAANRVTLANHKRYPGVSITRSGLLGALWGTAIWGETIAGGCLCTVTQVLAGLCFLNLSHVLHCFV